MAIRPLSRAEALAQLASIETEILKLGVSRLALFGSVQRNEARTDSDVDVLVQFAPGMKSFDRLLALGELLESCLAKPVELVTIESLSPFIGRHILAEAQDVVRAA